MRRAEMEISWADNLLTHEQEIKARPKREWFRTTRDKAAKKKVMKAVSRSGVGCASVWATEVVMKAVSTPRAGCVFARHADEAVRHGLT